MKKAHEYLAELNAVRNELGMMQLSSWKGSNEEIKNQIAKLRNRIAEYEAIKRSREHEEENTTLNKVAKLLKLKKPKPLLKPAKIIPATVEDEEVEEAAETKTETTASQIVKAASMNPKVARAKLRKAFGSNWRNKTAAEINAVLFPKKD